MFALCLLFLSAAFYLLHYWIFRDAHHIFVFLVEDIAFVFIEVLLVSLIIHRIISYKERQSQLEKLKMIIGVFFSEMGTKLLLHISSLDSNLDKMKNELMINYKWSNQHFINAKKAIKEHNYQLDLKSEDLYQLKTFILEKRHHLIRILENPILLEHECFTDLLQAVLHLAEELGARDELHNLPDTDFSHLVNDIGRIYILLTLEWLDYMFYLKGNYPYIYDFSLRINPFDQNHSPVIKK
ncbi:MAG: hypothetical protein K9L17_04890 [Clostridiales bacterium]|nr:hypothetical protein [Clostridiales bacterium]